MTWTYDPTQLATSTLYEVRLLIGDVISAAPQLQDEEITSFIGARASLYGAAALCCRSLAARYSRSVTEAAGGTSKDFSDLAKAYRASAVQFEAMAASGVSPYAGGISVADKQQQEQNTDRVAPQFDIGMEDNYLPIAPAGNETEGSESYTGG